jgi:hypothetical protein
MANRKGVAATTTTDDVDRRPVVPDIYRKVLPVFCLRLATDAAINRSPYGWAIASDNADRYAEWQAAVQAEADQLVMQHRGKPIFIDSYDIRNANVDLPKRLGDIRYDPFPRGLTISPDDRLDASGNFHKWRDIRERWGHRPNADHELYRYAEALGVEWGC